MMLWWQGCLPHQGAGWSKSLGTGDACRRGTAFGYEPVRLKLRRAEKVARCNWRSNLPDLTLIHGRGMTAAQLEAKGERASTRPRKKVPVIRTLCEIPALMLPSKPCLMSSFGQGQAVTSRWSAPSKRALWIGAGPPGTWYLILFGYFFLVEMIFSKLAAKAFYLGNWRMMYWRKSMAIFPSYIQLTFSSLLLIPLSWDPTASDFIHAPLHQRKTYSLTRPSFLPERQPLGGERQFKSERWGLMAGQARSSIYLIQHNRFYGLAAQLLWNSSMAFS